MKVHIALAFILIIFASCMQTNTNQETTLPGDFTVDLNKYAGLWYEAARMPNRFEKGCDSVTAEYTILESGKVKVVNSCLKENGEFKQSEGTAKVVKNSPDNRKLKVTFFWPFSGDYWIIYLDDEYAYAIVSDPKREYGWILAREVPVPDEKMKELISRCQDWGLDKEKMIF